MNTQVKKTRKTPSRKLLTEDKDLIVPADSIPVDTSGTVPADSIPVDTSGTVPADSIPVDTSGTVPADSIPAKSFEKVDIFEEVQKTYSNAKIVEQIRAQHLITLGLDVDLQELQFAEFMDHSTELLDDLKAARVLDRERLCYKTAQLIQETSRLLEGQLTNSEIELFNKVQKESVHLDKTTLKNLSQILIARHQKTIYATKQHSIINRISVIAMIEALVKLAEFMDVSWLKIWSAYAEAEIKQYSIPVATIKEAYTTDGRVKEEKHLDSKIIFSNLS